MTENARRIRCEWLPLTLTVLLVLSAIVYMTLAENCNMYIAYLSNVRFSTFINELKVVVL